MSSPSINFRSIRPHHGSQHGGFEEMVCQLAALETARGVPFHHKGAVADAELDLLPEWKLTMARLAGRPSISSNSGVMQLPRLERNH